MYKVVVLGLVLTTLIVIEARPHFGGDDWGLFPVESSTNIKGIFKHVGWFGKGADCHGRGGRGGRGSTTAATDTSTTTTAATTTVAA